MYKFGVKTWKLRDLAKTIPTRRPGSSHNILGARDAAVFARPLKSDIILVPYEDELRGERFLVLTGNSTVAGLVLADDSDPRLHDYEFPIQIVSTAPIKFEGRLFETVGSFAALLYVRASTGGYLKPGGVVDWAQFKAEATRVIVQPSEAEALEAELDEEGREEKPSGTRGTIIRTQHAGFRSGIIKLPPSYREKKRQGR